MTGWLRIKPAARYAGISERLFRDWIKAGLRHVRMPSGLLLTRPAWVDEWLEQFEAEGNHRAELDRLVDEVVDSFK